MSESIENLIEVTNYNIKSESENIQEYITEISIIQNTKNHKKLEDLSDSLNHSLKITRRLKLLRNKYKRIQSEIKELSYYVYKPEEIDSDNELQWEREEMSGKIYTMKSNDTTDNESDSEDETDSQDESDSEDETDSEKFKKELAKTAIINSMKYGMKFIGPKIIETMNNINKKNDEEDTKPTIETPIKFNRESKSI